MSSHSNNPAMDSTPLLMSGASLPNPQPAEKQKDTFGPQVVGRPEPPERRRSYGWVWLLAVAAAGGAGYWYWQQQKQQNASAQVAVLRTAVAKTAPLQKILRLTGVTAAEKYVSLIAPSLRGGRGNGGNGQAAIATTRTTSTTLASTSMSGSNLVSSTSASSSATANGSQFTSGSDSLASSAGGAASNLRSAVSVSSGASAGGSTGANSVPKQPPKRTVTSGTSNTAGTDGMGSTSSQLNGGNGGLGNGVRSSGGDFQLQIQELADNGIRVRKGDSVAEFDRQYMLLRLDDFKANVEQAENSMKASLATLDVTRKSYQQQILAAKNLVEKAELDVKTIPVRSAIASERLRLALEEARANLKQLEQAAKFVDIGERAQIKASELDLQQSKLELRRAQANADRMIVKAPMDGLVVMQNTFRAGEFGAIRQGDQVFPGQMFMQIVEPSSMVIDATVSQVDVQYMRLGQKAKVRFDAFPDLELPGHVIMIGAITKASGTRADFKKDLAVRLRLDQVDPRVIPDLSVSADVVLDEKDNSIVIPSEAILTSVSTGESGGNEKPFVMVRSANGQWKRREIEVGLTSNVHAAVLSGLNPGDIVALEDPFRKIDQSGQPAKS